MQEQQPTSGAAQEGIIMKPTGVWCYRWRTCNDVFSSRQGLAGHQHKHISEGTLIKGETHHKFISLSADLPAIHLKLGKQKSNPTVLRGQGCFYHPRPKKGRVESPRRLCGRPRLIYDQSQQDTVCQVPHVSTHAPTPNPLLNKADSFALNHSQLVSYEVKLNLNASLPNKLVESINSLMRNTNSCGQKELDLENNNQQVEQPKKVNPIACFFGYPLTFQPSTFSWVNESLTQPCYVAKGAFIIPVLRKGGWRVSRRLRGRPRLIYDQSQQDTVLQVPHVSTHAPTPNPLFNKAELFTPNNSQLVSYGVKLNLNAPLPNKPVESINSSMRNTSICGQEELDLELRL
ncbi:hypothetical protein H5410_057418 [Solanum commersonii]|uniref:C2H2-type domain-containing protein n=1 Tax=Solanum commersonii TaxID=4109 RepID=A0A9J5WQ44_SOLCO|nr:hypothetical protein H5410_057418 [Solanum commersonii]